MSDWTLTIGTTTQPLAAWGLMSCQLKLQSLAADTFNCTAVPDSLDAAPLIPHGTSVALYSPDGTCRFRGTSHNPSLKLAGQQWRYVYTCQGPWYDLEQLVFQQTWTRLDHNTDSEVSADGAEIIFGLWYSVSQDEYGNDKKTLCTVTTAQMLTSIASYAAAQGLSVSLGTLPTGINVPPWTAKDISVAAAIKGVLKWHPTAVSYWDYTTPFPTLNIVSASALPFVSVDCYASATAGVELTPRHDLQIKGVIVRYKRIKLVHELKIKHSNGDYEWKLENLVSASQTTYGGRDREYEYTTSYSGGDVSKLPGVLIYSVDWTSYYDSDLGGEKIGPPVSAAAHIFAESASLQYEGSIALQDAACPIISWGQLNLSNGPTLGGTACISGIAYDLDTGTTSLSIGPYGTLGIDWVDLLARRTTDSDATGVASAAAGSADSGLTDEQADALDQAGELLPILKDYEEESTYKVYEQGPLVVKMLVRKL